MEIIIEWKENGKKWNPSRPHEDLQRSHLLIAYSPDELGPNGIRTALSEAVPSHPNPASLKTRHPGNTRGYATCTVHEKPVNWNIKDLWRKIIHRS